MQAERCGSFIKKTTKTYDALCLFGHYFDPRLISSMVTRILEAIAIASAAILALLMLMR